MLCSYIHSYHSSGDEKALGKCENEISICERKSDELTQKWRDLQKTINQLWDRLANAEVTYNIDNMQLKFIIVHRSG